MTARTMRTVLALTAFAAPQFGLMKELDLPGEVKADIYRENAKRLFGFE